VEYFKVKGKNNVDIDVVKVTPKKPKAILQIFHGMGEHKERYLDFMKFLSENNIACYAHDHPKHGKSVHDESEVGIFGPNDTWDDVYDDAYFVSRKIMKEHPGLPMYLLGHSMGSIIARGFISRYNTVHTKVIIMGTLPPMSAFKAFVPLSMARLISIFKGKKRSPFLAGVLNAPLIKPIENPNTEFDWITSDEKIVEKYVEDPLCGYAYNPKFYVEFIKAIVDVNKSNRISETKDIPILFVSGAVDPVGENGDGVKEVERIYNGHGYTQLTSKLFENMRHEVLNEKGKKEVYDYLLAWLLK
jgi:alpha-beta hydrolase superfamily lysophospholipase